MNVGESDNTGVGSDENKKVSVPPLVLRYTSQNTSKEALLFSLYECKKNCQIPVGIAVTPGFPESVKKD